MYVFYPVVKFKATPRKIGSSYVVTVPKQYIDNKIVELEKENTFFVMSPEFNKHTNHAVMAEVTKGIIQDLTKRVEDGDRISNKD